MTFGVRKLESWGYQVVKKSTLAFCVLTQYWLMTDRQTRCDRYYSR